MLSILSSVSSRRDASKHQLPRPRPGRGPSLLPARGVRGWAGGGGAWAAVCRGGSSLLLLMPEGDIGFLPCKKYKNIKATR